MELESLLTEIKEFSQNLGLSNENSFIGLSNVQIQLLEKETESKFGNSFKTHLKHFGQKGRLGTNNIGLNQLSISHLEECQRELSEDYRSDGLGEVNWRKIIIEELNNNEEILKICSDKKPILLSYFEEGGVITFTPEKTDEFVLINYNWESKEFSFGYPKFYRYWIRTKLFNCFKPLFFKTPKDRESEDSTFFDKQVNKIPWIKFYYRMSKIGMDWSGKNNFWLIAEQMERKMQRTLSIDEYEIENLKYLTKNRNRFIFDELNEISNSNEICWKNYL